MMVGTPMDDPFSLEDFSISFEDDLPHEDDGRKATHPLLARRLWSLMSRAACHVIPPLSAKPDSAVKDELEAISGVARHWRVGSVALTERLWTRTGPYWRGEIARTLVLGLQAAAQGFLLLLVKYSNPSGCSFGSRRPPGRARRHDGTDRNARSPSGAYRLQDRTHRPGGRLPRVLPTRRQRALLHAGRLQLRA